MSQVIRFWKSLLNPRRSCLVGQKCGSAPWKLSPGPTLVGKKFLKFRNDRPDFFKHLVNIPGVSFNAAAPCNVADSAKFYRLCSLHICSTDPYTADGSTAQLKVAPQAKSSLADEYSRCHHGLE